MGLLLRGKVQGLLDAVSSRLPHSLAVALDLAPGDPDHAGTIRGAQIAAINRLTPLAMAASCLNAAILLATFWAAGALQLDLWIWSAAVFVLAGGYLVNWARHRRPEPGRPASRRAIRRAVLNGAIFGALWGVLPVLVFARAPLEIQLFVAVLTAGMMCAGGFILASVPLAGDLYVVLVAAGAFYALLQEGKGVYLGITALLVVYTAVVIVNLNWSATLFVSSLLAEAHVRREVAVREQAQAQAAHAERMNALGQLAGGIAHDFNNVLQVVSGSAALIKRHLHDPAYIDRQAGRMDDAVERGGAISRRLLAFARRDTLTAEPIEAADLLRGVMELLEPALGPAITVKVETDDDVQGVLADRRQLETVLLNLATNARDAMPNGGTLSVSVAKESLEHDSEAPPLKAGRYLRLAVSDTGEGMDAATLARAAEPFFTTKPKGKGTGLGLSMAKGFAEQSGGGFAIASAPGRGATVTLWLPQVEPSAPQTAAPDVPASQPGGRRILVVDDDEDVREMLLTSLEDAGYRATGAGGVDEALARLDERPACDAVVTDLSMPGKSGWDLVEALQARGMDLPVIMLTGNVGDERAEAPSHPYAGRFLLIQKPVPPAQLSARLAKLIDGG